MEVSRYGMNGFDFSNGININEIEIEKWIKILKKKFEKSPEEPYHYIQSGNTIVYGFKYKEEFDNKDIIEFHICKNISTFEYEFKPSTKVITKEKLNSKYIPKGIRLRI